jgi:hypothetical protein
MMPQARTGAHAAKHQRMSMRPDTLDDVHNRAQLICRDYQLKLHHSIQTTERWAHILPDSGNTKAMVTVDVNQLIFDMVD